MNTGKSPSSLSHCKPCALELCVPFSHIYYFSQLASFFSTFLFSPQLWLNKKFLSVFLWWSWWHVLFLAHTSRRSLRRRPTSTLAPLFPDFSCRSLRRPIASKGSKVLHPSFRFLMRLLPSLLMGAVFFHFGRGSYIGTELPKWLNRNRS